MVASVMLMVDCMRIDGEWREEDEDHFQLVPCKLFAYPTA